MEGLTTYSGYDEARHAGGAKLTKVRELIGALLGTLVVALFCSSHLLLHELLEKRVVHCVETLQPQGLTLSLSRPRNSVARCTCEGQPSSTCAYRICITKHTLQLMPIRKWRCDRDLFRPGCVPGIPRAAQKPRTYVCETWPSSRAAIVHEGAEGEVTCECHIWRSDGKGAAGGRRQPWARCSLRSSGQRSMRRGPPHRWAATHHRQTRCPLPGGCRPSE